MIYLDSKFEKRFFTKAAYAREKNLSPKSVQAQIDSGSLKVQLVGERELIVEEELCVKIPIQIAGLAIDRLLRFKSQNPEFESIITNS